MARHLMARFQAERAVAVSDWKLDELVAAMNLRLQVLIANGVTTTAAIEHHFFDRSEDNRNDYATGQ